MSGPLILVCMGIYFFVGLDQLSKGNMGAALMWTSYGCANIGLWMTTK